MKNILKYFFILAFVFIYCSTNYIVAQEQSPTYQSLIQSGDTESFINIFSDYETILQDNVVKTKKI